MNDDIGELITRILRDHKVIDTGISETIAQCVNQWALNMINENIRRADIATQFYSAFLSRMDYDHIEVPFEMEHCIKQADHFIRMLNKGDNANEITKNGSMVN